MKGWRRQMAQVCERMGGVARLEEGTALDSTRGRRKLGWALGEQAR